SWRIRCRLRVGRPAPHAEPTRIFCPHRRVGAARRDHRRRPLQRIRAHPAPATAFRRPVIRVSMDSVRSGAARTGRRAGAAGGMGWWDRHFLPIFAIEHSTMVAAEQAVRGLIAVVGAALLLVLRRPIAAILRRATIGGALRVLLAVAVALGAGELILRAHPP